MSISKAFYEIFERNFRTMSEKFEDSLQQVAKIYNGMNLSYPFFYHPFMQRSHHEKDHLHSQHSKSESAINRKTP